ncbi:MAG: hypothetical protein HQL52_16355 [Magnetococcales bacterium]|nr:hypothetical protein [Magnetococcales bacterium]
MTATLQKRKTARSRLMALFSYMGILCLVPLMVNQDDEFVFFHARQGLVLWIWGVIAILALHVPVIGPFFFSFSVLMIAVFSLAGLVSVALTRAWRLPVISLLAEKM